MKPKPKKREKTYYGVFNRGRLVMFNNFWLLEQGIPLVFKTKAEAQGWGYNDIRKVRIVEVRK